MGAWDFRGSRCGRGIRRSRLLSPAVEVRQNHADAKRTVVREIQEEFADLEVGPTAWLSLALAMGGWSLGPTNFEEIAANDQLRAVCGPMGSSQQTAKQTLQPAKTPHKVIVAPAWRRSFGRRSFELHRLEAGECFRFQLRKGLYALLRLTDVSKGTLAFAIVDWHGAKVPPQKEVEKLPVGSGEDFVAVTRCPTKNFPATVWSD